MFKGKQSDTEDIEGALHRKIRELKKNLEEKLWCLEETSKQE
jgi:hypothetical protein